MATIVRHSLREQVRADIADRIVRGLIPRGQSVNEVELAGQLGVSRTPVREALMALETAGLLQRRATGGFEVLPLTPAEVLDIYPIIAALESYAVAASDPATLAAQVPRLRTMADAVVAAAGSGPELARDGDDAFHDQFVSCAGNKELRKLLASLKTRLRRYEFAFMADMPSVEESRRQHHDIVDAIEARQIARARKAIEHNWRSTMEHLLDLMTPE